MKPQPASSDLQKTASKIGVQKGFVSSQISMQMNREKNCTRTVLFASNCCKAQEDISWFPLEYEEEKENSFPRYTGSAPSENTCENKPDISKDEIKVRWFI